MSTPGAVRVSWFDPQRPVNGTVFVRDVPRETKPSRRLLRAAGVLVVLLVAGGLLVGCAPHATAHHPALHDIGREVARAGDHVAATAGAVDEVPVPVPVLGTPSCWRPPLCR